MQILVVHNRYRSAIPSGENAVVDNEISALRAAGHHVATYLRESDEIATMSSASRLAHVASPLHSASAVRAVQRLVTTVRPDVVHLHNPYPLVSMSVVSAVRRLGVPCVQTIHNHRHTCMKGTYQRDGRDCRSCLLAGHPGPGVLHACYRGSRAQSAVMAAALLRGRPAYRQIDRLIALTPELAESLRRSGFDPSRVVVRPNSVPDPGPPTPPGAGFTFVGRLSEEKGVLVLARAWTSFPDGSLGALRIVGDGPDRDHARRLLDGRDDVWFLGRLDPAGVHRAMSDGAVVVVPSLSPEGFPLVVLEAMAAGRALLVTDQEGLASVVDETIGRVVRSDSDSLAAGLASLSDDPATVRALGSTARERYDSLYHPDVAIRRLVAIYEDVVASRRVA